ncbi:MAG: helix-turn-helix domain-containing protein, partial [Bacteroidota bacterium]
MIWKALSDPTRRTILDVLQQAPQTTGELSSRFGHLSRYAVMKHLGILEKANLIVIKREGKYRWNYLNASPLQTAYDQWVSKLINLKHAGGQIPSSVNQRTTTLSAMKIDVESQIGAPKLKVWQAITEQSGQWWPKSLFTHPTTEDFIIEAKLGGLMYEVTRNGEGTVWANVIGLDSPNFIHFKGHLTPALGGPAVSFLH